MRVMASTKEQERGIIEVVTDLRNAAQIVRKRSEVGRMAKAASIELTGASERMKRLNADPEFAAANACPAKDAFWKARQSGHEMLSVISRGGPTLRYPYVLDVP